MTQGDTRRFDIEKEAEKLLNKLRTAIPKDENGYCADFLYLYRKAGYLEDDGMPLMDIIVGRMQIIFDRAYYYMFKNEEERNAYKAKAVLDFGGYSRLSGRMFCQQNSWCVEPLESWERCLDAFDKLNKMCTTLELTTGQSPSFAKCLFMLWSFFNHRDWSNDLTWLVKWLGALCNVCQRAASADFDAAFGSSEPRTPEDTEPETPTPAPQVVTQAPAPTKPRGKKWTEDKAFYFEQCYRILKTSSHKDKRGNRTGPFTVYNEKGEVVKTIPAGKGAVKEVFSYVEEHIRALSEGKYLSINKSAQRQYYSWEKERKKQD